MTRSNIMSIFWNEKFLKSLDSYHFGIVNESDILKHETFSVAITWFERYLDHGFSNGRAARAALYARLNNEVGLVLSDEELDNIMK